MHSVACAANPDPRTNVHSLLQRGAALVEMAILLPVLCLCFYGIIEIGQYLTMSERMTKTVNQLSAVLYTLRPSDLQAGGSANNVIGVAIRQAQTLAKPYSSPTIVVRYCQRRTGGGTGPMEQIYFGATTPRIQGCDDGPACQDSLITQSDYGAYVQAYACQRFQPVLTPRFFKSKAAGQALGADTPTSGNGAGGGILVKQVAFIPLTDTNQTALIRKAGSLAIPTTTAPAQDPEPIVGCAAGSTPEPGTDTTNCTTIITSPPADTTPPVTPPTTPETCEHGEMNGVPTACLDPQTDCIALGGAWNGRNCTMPPDPAEECAAQGAIPNPSGSGCITPTRTNPNEVRGSDGQCTEMPCGDSGYWIPPYSRADGGPQNAGGCVLTCPGDMAVDDRGGFGYCVPSVCQGSGLECNYQVNPTNPPTSPTTPATPPDATPVDTGCPDGFLPGPGGSCSL